MTVKELIKVLEKMPKDKIVVLADTSGIWDNIGKVVEEVSTVIIAMEEYNPFEG